VSDNASANACVYVLARVGNQHAGCAESSVSKMYKLRTYCTPFYYGGKCWRGGSEPQNSTSETAMAILDEQPPLRLTVPFRLRPGLPYASPRHTHLRAQLDDGPNAG
jgi:hypothetical protein